VAAVSGGAVITVPEAHAGHYLSGLLYLLPIVLLAAALGIQSLRDKRKRGDKQESAEKRRKN
jgi:hypothetical protein